ncbi:allantoicase [Mycolicibacterium parafortuitum]|uniref:Probable allantoicase n=1 Tax=Mycolicibacterium parafortuitum TaxID=39692 RepID=A0A375YBX2_MYCPF|nr:allantoicase [Mycolicibacterium parafortuitum]ORB32007.1 allantoicase [Mycolicibacterium parafortuitum]SRX78606.1 allantoicase [Nocardia brasiliensis ATCC] [Mycolicibacterium parafortuitum]
MSTAPAQTHFLSLPDLAARSAGGAVLWANDDLFAEKENLIKPGPAEHRPATFGHKGQVYDGWETRRRRGATADSHDFAIVRLAAPAVIRGVVVDTAWFTGNYPPQISVDAAFVEGYPSAEELAETTEWTRIVDRRDVNGDTRNPFEVDSPRRWTHVRLAIYPDGGVARFRVHGEGLLDPRFTEIPLDLAALENGGRITACSNMFYSSPNNLLLPGSARTMGEGWETSRRRDSGNDWVQVHLAGQGVVAAAEIDTSYFIGNAPGAARLRGRDGDGEWFDLLETTELRPDTRHRVLLDSGRPVTEARLDIYPDGGLARLRLFGRLTADGLRVVNERWEASA